jgi:predicted nuclease of predicted toxin-antitoxin system
VVPAGAILLSDRFLIDECLTPELVAIANELGFEAHHVVYLGLSGRPDHLVFRHVAEGGYVFVTNDREDWCNILSRVDLHAGLVVIVPKCRREIQKRLFRAALEHVKASDGLLNRVLQIYASCVIEVFELPSAGEEMGSCPEAWCKSGGGIALSGWVWPACHAGGTADSMMIGSSLTGTMVSRLM